jgi:hypothetical protein
LDDAAVRQASERFVRLIVRRPHAYEFRQKFRGKAVPVPGMAFLDCEGKLRETAAIEDAKALVEKLRKVAGGR